MQGRSWRAEHGCIRCLPKSQVGFLRSVTAPPKTCIASSALVDPARVLHERLQPRLRLLASSNIPQRSRPFANGFIIRLPITRAANNRSEWISVFLSRLISKLKRMPQKFVGPSPHSVMFDDCANTASKYHVPRLERAVMETTLPKTNVIAIRDSRGRYLKGMPGGPGRPFGSRNKLREDFFAEHGPEGINWLIAERPELFLMATLKITQVHRVEVGQPENLGRPSSKGVALRLLEKRAGPKETKSRCRCHAH